MHGTLEIIAALVSAGADVNASVMFGYTPLHIVALYGAPESITVLLEAGASGSVKTKNGSTPFDLTEVHLAWHQLNRRP